MSDGIYADAESLAYVYRVPIGTVWSWLSVNEVSHIPDPHHPRRFLYDWEAVDEIAARSRAGRRGELLSMSEAGRRLGIDRRKIGKMIDDGILQGVNIGGAQGKRVPEEEIARFRRAQGRIV